MGAHTFDPSPREAEGGRSSRVSVSAEVTGMSRTPSYTNQNHSVKNRDPALPHLSNNPAEVSEQRVREEVSKSRVWLLALWQ